MKKLYDRHGLLGMLRAGDWNEKEFVEVIEWLKPQVEAIPVEHRLAVDRMLDVLVTMYEYTTRHDFELARDNVEKLSGLYYDAGLMWEGVGEGEDVSELLSWTSKSDGQLGMLEEVLGVESGKLVHRPTQEGVDVILGRERISDSEKNSQESDDRTTAEMEKYSNIDDLAANEDSTMLSEENKNGN